MWDPMSQKIISFYEWPAIRQQLPIIDSFKGFMFMFGKFSAKYNTYPCILYATYNTCLYSYMYILAFSYTVT